MKQQPPIAMPDAATLSASTETPSPANPVFYNDVDAQKYFDENEDASAIISNSPRPGCSTVSMVKPPLPNETLADLFRPLHNQWTREEARDRDRYEQWLNLQAHYCAGQEIACERGLDEVSSRYFVEGFAGVHAKISNPRTEGMEPIFREGRHAKANPDAQRRCRVLMEALRPTDSYSFEAWLDNIAYPVSPVHWRAGLRG